MSAPDARSSLRTGLLHPQWLSCRSAGCRRRRTADSVPHLQLPPTSDILKVAILLNTNPTHDHHVIRRRVNECCILVHLLSRLLFQPDRCP